MCGEMGWYKYNIKNLSQWFNKTNDMTLMGRRLQGKIVQKLEDKLSVSKLERDFQISRHHFISRIYN